MKIWIDAVNSPHVLFFRPLILNLKSRGHEVIVTSRSFGHTEDLLDRFGIEYFSFDEHRGSSIFNKLRGLFNRSFQLIKFAKKQKFDIALTHNSSDIAIASKILAIPLVSMFDYEYAYSHHINIRCSKKVIFPEYIDMSSLTKYGIYGKMVYKYKGLKEQMYLSDFSIDESVSEKLNLNEDKVIITIRPPAFHAHYHLRHENKIFWSLLNRLDKMKNVKTIVVPRDKSQLILLKNLNFSNVKILEEVVDGPSLIYFSDIVLSGGGTMNREAVALGTKVFTMFSPKMGGVDNYLVENNLLGILDSDINLQIRKYEKTKPLPSTSCDDLVNLILK